MEVLRAPTEEEVKASKFLSEHKEEQEKAYQAIRDIISNRKNLDDILEDSNSLFEKQQAYLGEINTDKKIVFVGDTHGAFDVTLYTLMRFLRDDTVGKIVFLGDYVDRGPESLENLILILREALAEKEKGNEGKLVILRGNHESPITNYYYGFVNELSKKVPEYPYEKFVEMFSNMPYAITVNGYFCVHGGLAKDMNSDSLSDFLKDVNKLNSLPKAKGDQEPSDPVAMQILWNDPRDCIDGFLPNVRGEGTFYFGRKVVKDFLDSNNQKGIKIKGIIRAHEVKDGYSWEMDGKVITVFSSRYHQMSAGVLIMDENKSFHVLKILGENE
ncbi:metallophosphoesterase [Sulfuracidifex metallicus]|uniref:metallophosphoesterase n=1 Tax=Sulfuracidifex metallicus TaxID=47303 RepID=UPI002275AD5F|nr:metallophosphoesterase [Sulfuracidifex metallicus]MCY0850397.1 metallophosphoesterase [Sulfuracidifex metallicus]